MHGRISPQIEHRLFPQIEHRLFAQISKNWRARPLTSHEVIIQTIAATTTTTGLEVTAALDQGRYPTGIRVTGKQVQKLEDTGAGFSTWALARAGHRPCTGGSPGPRTRSDQQARGRRTGRPGIPTVPTVPTVPTRNSLGDCLRDCLIVRGDPC